MQNPGSMDILLQKIISESQFNQWNTLFTFVTLSNVGRIQCVPGSEHCWPVLQIPLDFSMVNLVGRHECCCNWRGTTWDSSITSKHNFPSGSLSLRQQLISPFDIVQAGMDSSYSYKLAINVTFQLKIFLLVIYIYINSNLKLQRKLLFPCRESLFIKKTTLIRRNEFAAEFISS